MRRIVVILMLSLMCGVSSLYAQSVDPSFPGGEEAMLSYLSENIQYPAYAAENGIEGVVTVEFMVNADGSIGETKVVRMVDPELEDEAVRVIKSMPRWNPATVDGQPVAAWFRLPVKFRISESTE